MLTLLEKNMQRAALHGNYETYLALFNQWEALQEKPIPTEKLSSIFISAYIPELGSAPSLLNGLLAEVNPTPESAKERSKILEHILDQLHAAEMEIFFSLQHTQALSWSKSDSLQQMHATSMPSPNNPSLFEWAIMNNAPNILNHPLVQKEVVLTTLRDFAKAKDAANLKRVFESNKKTHHLSPELYLQGFVSQSIWEEPWQADKRNDLFLAELMKAKYLNTDIFLPLKHGMGAAGMPLETIFQNMPTVKQTEFFKLCSAIETLDVDQDPNQQAAVLALIESYFKNMNADDKKIVATCFISFATDAWRSQARHSPLSQSNKGAQMAVLIKFMNYGGGLGAFPPLGIQPHNDPLSYVINSRMMGVLKINNAFEGFKGFGLPYQKTYLQHFLQEPIDDDSPKILASLCQHLTTHDEASFDATNPMLGLPTSTKFSPEELVSELNKIGTDEKVNKNLIKMIGILLNYDLVEKDNIRPGSHTIAQIDPNTSAPYDLYAFIQDTPILRKTWDNPGRDKQLIELYKITKALLQNEDRTEQELKEIDQETSFQHGEHTYSLIKIQEWMRNNDFLRENVLSWVDPAKESQEEREKVVRKLTRIYQDKQIKDKSASSPSSAEKPSQSEAAENPSSSIKKKSK